MLSRPEEQRDNGARPVDMPRWVWLVYLALFSASVPWYIPDGPIRIWFGLPHWVVLSIGAIAASALFTQFVVRWYWRDDDEAESRRADSPERGR